MALWKVVRPSNVVKTLKSGVDTMIVSATDATDAKAIATANQTGDSTWADATATELTEINVNTATALTGWRFKIIVFTATPKVFELTAAGASQDTLDEIGAALATLINLDADISGAAYTAATQTLIVADGGGVDDLGDMAMTVEVFPPVVQNAQGEQINQNVAIPGFVASITDEGNATDDLVVEFAADTLLVPTVWVTGKSS
jgi:hypothetical protein